MRAAIVVCLVFLVAFVAASSMTEEETRFMFNRWLLQHKKNYRSLVELTVRYKNFQENMRFIAQHNAEAAQGLHTFTVAANQFTDMSRAEYLAMLTFKPTIHPAPQLHAFDGRVGDLPTSVDWRTKGLVTGVKDQGQCGSCWAFSAIASMEGAHAYDLNATLTSFSEQNLVDCVNNGQCTCDVGGYMQWGFDWAISSGGIEGETDYPYCACSYGVCKFDKTKVKGTFVSYVNVTVGSEADLQSAAVARPGVSVAIDASSMQFQFYSGGVFNYPLCGNKFEDLDHGVTVVGYGVSGSSDYWLVKNSWGGSWGLQGYIWMSRNKSNQCGIATDASYVLAK